MRNIDSQIAEIQSHILEKGHANIEPKSIDLYFRFLLENKFHNSQLLLEVFQRDFFEINLEVINKDELTVKWVDIEETITTKNQTLILLLLSHDEEDIRRGNRMPEKLAMFDGLVFFAEKNIPNFKPIFNLIVKHKK